MCHGGLRHAIYLQASGELWGFFHLSLLDSVRSRDTFTVGLQQCVTVLSRRDSRRTVHQYIHNICMRPKLDFYLLLCILVDTILSQFCLIAWGVAPASCVTVGASRGRPKTTWQCRRRRPRRPQRSGPLSSSPRRGGACAACRRVREGESGERGCGRERGERGQGAPKSVSVRAKPDIW